MSGGVDSSVAAALLMEQGHEVVGCFMRLGSDDSFEAEVLGYDNLNAHREACRSAPARKQGCCSVNDAADARLVAATLGLPFYVMNFKRDFGRVIDYFVEEYNAGRTPNPCVRCNDWLKFGRLHDYAASIGCSYVASGHYAQVIEGPGGAELHRGIDTDKDQSYVLFGTPPTKLAAMLLPIGGLQKAEVRQRAERLDLPVFDKPDSQEICFVPDQDYAGLVDRRLKRSGGQGIQPGPILDQTGAVVGEHRGHQHYTVGQRRGVGVAFGYPIYVIHKNADDNSVTIGPRAALSSSGCVASRINWLRGEVPDAPIECEAVLRYQGQPHPAHAWVQEDRLLLRFKDPVEAVTPGQAVVCYEGDRVLGGGWIDHAVEPEG